MERSKIAEILRTFSKEELKSFGKFIISPFFATRRDIKGFYTELKKYHPDFRINREDLFARLFPEEKYDERKHKNLSAQLVMLAEHFLAHLHLKENNVLSRKLVVKEYKKRSSESLFWKGVKKAEENNSLRPFNSTFCFNEQEEIEFMKIDHLSETGDFENSFRLRLKHTDYVIASFLIRFFRRLNDKNGTESYNIPFESPLMNAVIQNINFDKIVEGITDGNSEIPKLLKIYFYAYKTNYEIQNDDLYYNYKKLLYENIGMFDDEEKFLLFNDLMDAATNKRLSGKTEFQREQFNLYKDMMVHKAYISDGGKYMSVVLYRNIVFIALILGEFDWLKDFVNKYSDTLRPEYIINMKNHALAHICFETEKLEEALSYSSKVKFDFFVYKIDIKHLLLKIYFQLDLYEQAYSMIDTYRHYLRESNELSDYHKKWHYEFLEIYTRLLKAKLNNDVIEAELVNKMLDSKKAILSGGWIRKVSNIIIKKGAV